MLMRTATSHPPHDLPPWPCRPPPRRRPARRRRRLLAVVTSTHRRRPEGVRRSENSRPRRRPLRRPRRPLQPADRKPGRQPNRPSPLTATRSPSSAWRRLLDARRRLRAAALTSGPELDADPSRRTAASFFERRSLKPVPRATSTRSGSSAGAARDRPPPPTDEHEASFSPDGCTIAFVGSVIAAAAAPRRPVLGPAPQALGCPGDRHRQARRVRAALPPAGSSSAAARARRPGPTPTSHDAEQREVRPSWIRRRRLGIRRRRLARRPRAALPPRPGPWVKRLGRAGRASSPSSRTVRAPTPSSPRRPPVAAFIADRRQRDPLGDPSSLGRARAAEGFGLERARYDDDRPGDRLAAGPLVGRPDSHPAGLAPVGCTAMAAAGGTGDWTPRRRLPPGCPHRSGRHGCCLPRHAPGTGARRWR